MAEDSVIDKALEFGDSMVDKMTELANRVKKLEDTLDGILKGHEGDTRDELKKRIEHLEGKLHAHFEAVKKSQGQ
jgi:BMFP domain-containing protein YqiC